MKWSVNGFVVEEAKNVIENYARIFMFDYFSDMIMQIISYKYTQVCILRALKET
jgi:hypothetical protein